MIDLAVKLDASPLWGSGSNQRWFDSLSVRWFLVDGSVPSPKSSFFKSDTPYQILSLSRGSFSLFFSGYNSTNPVKLEDIKMLAVF